MERAGKLKSVLDRIHPWFVMIAGLGLTFMVVMISADVVLRYVFNAPLPASIEISQLIEPYVVFFPFALALSLGSHVRVTLVTSRLSGKARMFSELIACAAGIIVFGVLTYYGWLHFWESFVVRETMLASIRLPWWIGKLAMPLGTALMTMQFVYEFLHALPPEE